MQIIIWNQLLKAINNNTLITESSAVTVGSFDGIHIGHQTLLQKVLLCEKKLSKVVVTFSRPTRLQKIKTYEGDILTLRLKLKKLKLLGFDLVVLIDFSKDFAKMTGEEFFDILIKSLHMKALFVGSDFSCGFQHSTDVNDIAKIAKICGFTFSPIERVFLDGQNISSSKIRKAIQVADFQFAKKLLGYSFLLDISDVGFKAVSILKFRTLVSAFTQVLPNEGKHKVLIYTNEGFKLNGFFYIIKKDAFLEILDNLILQKFQKDVDIVECFDYLEFIF